MINIVGIDGNLLNVLQECAGWQVKNLDALVGTDDQPVELLREKYNVDWGLTIRLGQVFSVNEVPDHDETITRAGCQVRRVLDHIDGVNLSLVASEGVHELHVKIIPDLDGLIPGGGNNVWVLLSVVELDA